MSLEEMSQKSELISLEGLQRFEEACKKALETSQLPLEEGGATEAEQQDLQERYIMAKQVREDFESTS